MYDLPEEKIQDGRIVPPKKICAVKAEVSLNLTLIWSLRPAKSRII